MTPLSATPMYAAVLIAAAAAAVVAVVVATAAWLAGVLTRSGAVAAAVCGWLAISAGWDWAIVLITYFISAACLPLVDKVRPVHRTRPVNDIVAKIGARDAAQVLANGGIFMMCALGSIGVPSPFWRAAALGSLAASAADTFATEIGSCSQRPPRSIVSGRLMPTGASGAISALGTFGAAVGGSFAPIMAYALGWPGTVAISAWLAGMTGMFADSLLGATVQERRVCPVCGSHTERIVHSCGATTLQSGGFAGIGNDLVNVFATIVGALMTTALLAMF